MKFRKWRFGLIVATLTGAATVFAIGLIVPRMTWREAVLILLGSIAKDVLLFSTQHPWTDVEFDAEVDRRARQEEVTVREEIVKPVVAETRQP